MPDKPLLIADPFPQVWERIFTDRARVGLEKLVSVEFRGDEKMPDEELDRFLPEAVALVGQASMPAGRLARAPKLKVIFNVEGNFYPNIDYETCFERGIHVLGCGPAYALPVAEMALCFAIDLARGISREDRNFRRGEERYLAEANHDSVLLSGSTVGVVGMGLLGRAFLRLIEPFRCRVLACDPWLPESELEDCGCEPAGLDELLATCGFIFVFAGVTTENLGFIGAREFDLIRPGSVFVLMSRAAVVDFDAMTACVASGRFKAASDAWPREPLEGDHPARVIENFLLSPHRAGAIPQAFTAIGDMLVDDLRLILDGFPPVRMQRAQRETVARFCSKPAD